ncbi:MAG: methyltransferase domain-containing protein [Flavobacteriales bacterium]
MADNSQEVVDTTKNYYDSEDADNFYYNVWGGEDIHVGLYNEIGESIYEASQRSVDKMTELIKDRVDANTRVVDVGAGYGGTARYFADKFGCHVDCLNLSDKENDLNKEKNEKLGYQDLVDVYGGNFEALPFSDDSYELAIAQDALLHSGNKKKVLEEVDRVLKSGGDFIFTDPMQADDCPEGVLKPVLERIHLDSMGSVAKYREMAKELGWEEVRTEEMPEQLVNHYSSVRKLLREKYDELKGTISTEYMDRMIEGLGHWVEKGENGYLNWGYIHFHKP